MSSYEYLWVIQKRKSNLSRKYKQIGWDTRIWTWECQDQNLVPYRLAISQQKQLIVLILIKNGAEGETWTLTS